MDTQAVSYIAIDVSKKTLEVLSEDWSKSRSVANSEAALEGLLKKHAGFSQSHFICEATGGYERALVGLLHSRGIAVSVVSPAKVRYFAQSEGVKAKTDPIDAKMLLRFAREKRPRATPAPSPQRKALAALMDRREHLSEQLKREKTRLQKCDGLVAQSVGRMIDIVEREIETVDGQIRRLVAGFASFAKVYETLVSVVGIGPVTAWTLLAYLPELGRLSRNQVVALAGLAPYNRDSGDSKKIRKIFGGRAKVRRCLYLAAVAAYRHNDVIRAYTQHFLDAGRPFKWAVVAAMRKLLIHTHYLVKKLDVALA
ncbi:Transposase IS116/IS110/IS902 family protein [Verrucomicrobiia bacterium DG1235]|nr:Transposase IS116/IS110/IS902 family protein [Verrucomicrobiae bacterium DG1235]EDY82961.1 Transposase IS116/IS110/IS902 family protein [Verrucomicrobiae bacterium DG1235]